MTDRQKDVLYDILGQNVKRIRSRMKLTQEQLATRISLTRTSVVNIEQGKQHPPVHILLDLAKALDVEIQDLIPNEKEYTGNSRLEEFIPAGVSSKDVERVALFYSEFQNEKGHE